MAMKTGNKENFYMPFDGQTLYGLGDVIKSDNPKFKKMFFNDRGKIYFNSYKDRQVRGMKKLVTP
jgi:hypothetical protein